MTPHYADDTVTLHHGDCLDVLRELPDASVDAVVTDPPYGLEFMGREWDGADGFRRSLNPADAGRDSVYGRTSRTSPEYRTGKPARSHIRTRVDQRTNPAEGKSTTSTPEAYVAGPLYQQWCEAWATECLRVLKPGGHLLAFGGTRTVHRLTCAIEDAGFEIRDGIDWIYASGFPKSLDVSKAIDRRAEPNVETKQRIAAVAKVIRAHREAKGMERAAVSLAVVGTPSGACWNWEHNQLPSVEMWPAIKAALDIPDQFDGLIEGDRAQFIAAEREVIGTGYRIRRESVVQIVGLSDGEYPVTAPATEDAARWAGWGTALKPAREPIVVARKPLTGAVAANVQAYGTGALNIDAARVGDGASGRWPSNVVFSHAPGCNGACVPGCPVAELDAQSGVLTSGANPTRRSSDKLRDAYGEFQGQTECVPARGADSGGASRFFPVFRYEAKAPTAERPKVDGIAHPTVKPLDLMRWLVRLVTPPGGIVLEPFAGSGTTAEACVLEGFRCVAIEREADYLPLIVGRLSKPLQVSLPLEVAA